MLCLSGFELYSSWVPLCAANIIAHLSFFGPKGTFVDCLFFY